MRPIRIFLPCDVLDSYIYSGHIFAVFKDGTLRALPLESAFAYLSLRLPAWSGLLNLAVLRNDWLLNPQAASFFHLQTYFQAFKHAWEELAQKELQVKLDSASKWRVLWELPSMPVYDLRLYAWRIYLTHRSGVHEGFLSFAQNRLNVLRDHLVQIFDARTIYVSAKSGELLFSADNDGLFRGTLWNGDEVSSDFLEYDHPARVYDRPYAAKSIRTGWSRLDTVNYDTHSHFSYIENEVRQVEQRPFRYSEQDESSRKVRISKFAARTYSMDAALGRLPFRPEEIRFCFNSSKAGFFILEDGRFLRANWSSDAERAGQLVSRISDLPLGDKAHSTSETGEPTVDVLDSDRCAQLGNVGNLVETAQKTHGEEPCSAFAFGPGVVIEFFDRVVLLYGSQVTTLEDCPVISVRAFPTSRRFKRIVCVTREDGIALHVVFPQDSEIARQDPRLHVRP